jgi:tetratricopeptide (TPR) repeat protein
MAQKLKKQTDEIYDLRAQSYLELKRYKEAVTDFESYLSSNPDDVKAILLQGKAFLKNGQPEEANINADKLLKLDPSKEILFSDNRKLDIYNLDLRREKAKQLLKDADILISERASSPSKTLANIKLTDAFKYLDTAWLCSPGLTKEDRNLKDTIREKLFVVYPLMKMKPEISEQVRRYVVQATSATQEKKYDNAVTLWTTTLNISPYLPIAYFNRALLYEMKGLFRYSISDLEKYVKLMPDASDARNSKDKIYELEAKVKETPESLQAFRPGTINQIQSTGYSPGNFIFAIAAGGGFGLQLSKNPGLADLWTSLVNGATPDYDYTDKMPFLYSGNLEMIVKPVRRIGIGAFGNWAGGIGCRTKVSETKYMMNMGSGQFGGLIRYYMILNNGYEKPDFFVQYAYGQTRLSGDYAVATMDGIIYDYSYVKEFKGTGPYNSVGVGMGGKIGKHGYITISLDYLNSKVKDFTSLVVTNTGNTSDEGTEGSVSGVNATYNGFEFKFLFGFCL